MSTVDAARMLALLALSNADTFISVWDSKLHCDYWRPRHRDQKRRNRWERRYRGRCGMGLAHQQPRLPRPLLRPCRQQRHGFDGPRLGLRRCDRFLRRRQRRTTLLNSFAAAAQDGADSRIYGGIHFRFETELGLAQGRSVANYVLANALGAVPEPGTWTCLSSASGRSAPRCGSEALRGCASATADRIRRPRIFSCDVISRWIVTL